MNVNTYSIIIEYDEDNRFGKITLEAVSSAPIWDRILQVIINSKFDYLIFGNTIQLNWPCLLDIFREFLPQQRILNFKFRSANPQTNNKLNTFISDYKNVQLCKENLTFNITDIEIKNRLQELGFTKRILTDFQIRDLQKLLSLQNGANFSVPGAGKTSVTFALHILTKNIDSHLLVIGPKSSFTAWYEVVTECMADDAPFNGAESFLQLSGLNAENVEKKLTSGSHRFIINYDALIQIPEIISNYLVRNKVHLVLDESHRMKAGQRSQRGSFLLSVSPFPVRRDILSGTPMPQQPSDLQSQLDFLWPGSGLGNEIERGKSPRDVLGQLYVRTTKTELGLPKPKRHFIQVEMAPGQLALYSVVRDESLRQFSNLRLSNNVDLLSAKKCVMRLLQLSSNPVLALRSIVQDSIGLDGGIIDAVIREGSSLKMRKVEELARDLAKVNKKTVIWTIFTDTIYQMELLLADLNPVSLFGAIPSGDSSDINTREGRIRRFHEDDNCMVMLANPAAAGEGISLHKVCHNAIYIDRSYVTTHYLQSIDRIHRLGLPKDTETNIYIYQTMAPRGMGCIDHSVSRRLAQKLRSLQILLDDPDLHEITLDEENADDPIDYDIEPQDIVDLINQLEGKNIIDDFEIE
ncbi:MAG: helicase [Spirochaetae bacterium HGW-Spirochaetae-5]|nr:MAG: helicase [Spirochaetae bacterium HGW-Spirochaetae-5]